jgi:Fic family protein
LLEFTSISRIVRGAPAKYARAFLYTETDDNDVTYLLLNQLRVIVRAIDDLYVYLRRKAEELRDTRQALSHSGVMGQQLNHRQLALLHHALRHPGHSYTFRSHRRSHDVSYQTARTDLMKLAELGLQRERQGGPFLRLRCTARSPRSTRESRGPEVERVGRAQIAGFAALLRISR